MGSKFVSHVRQFSQHFQLPLGVSVCVYSTAGRHAMLLQCANMYAGAGHSNTLIKYEIQFIWAWH